jgi:hypothetical protein
MIPENTPTFAARIIIIMGVIIAFPVPVFGKQKTTLPALTRPADACDVDAKELISRMIALASEVNGSFIEYRGEQARAYVAKLDDMNVTPHLVGDALLIVVNTQGIAVAASYDIAKGKFCGKALVLPAPIHEAAFKAASGTKI